MNESGPSLRGAEVPRSGPVDATPRLGLVSAFGAEADILIERTVSRRVWTLNGNRFVAGRLCGNDVVIVLCGVSMVNAAMVTQLMLDHFVIDRLVMSGIAGGVSPRRKVGDVVVPDRWVMPMELYWGADGGIPAPCGVPGELGPLGLKLAMAQGGQPLPDYRIPHQDQAIATGMFMRETFVRHERAPADGEFRFDYPVDARMLAVASLIAPKLATHGPKDPTRGVSGTPCLAVGGVGASAPVFLASPAYRAYLHETLHVEAMDMETAAFAHVAYANSVPYIAFRSISDAAGGDDSRDVGDFFGSGLAEANASAVTLAFLAAWSHCASSFAPGALRVGA
jgi:adenosylhomocysteine nucleosidase